MLKRVIDIAASALSLRYWRDRLGRWQARQFDRKHGTDTVQIMPVAAMRDVLAELRQHAVHYEATAMVKLRRALAEVQAHLGSSLHTYSFVDFGSGKGLVVMLASRESFRCVYGVEMAPELHEIATSNVRKYLARNPQSAPIELHCMDALSFECPDGNLVAYLYNPFAAPLVERLLRRLLALAVAGKQVLVVYVNPLHRSLFERAGCFQMVFDNGALCILRVRLPAGQRDLAVIEGAAE